MLADEDKDIEENKEVNIPDVAPCPFWMPIFPYLLAYGLLIFISWKYIDTKPVQWRFPVFNYVFGAICTVQFICIVYERYHYFGNAGFYETYWYCSCALPITLIGFIFDLPSLIGECMCLMLFPHVSFWVDSIIILITKKSLTGSAGWIFEKGTPWHEIFTTLHHFWYFPCIFICLYGQPVMPIQSYYLSILQFILLNIICHYMTPNTLNDKNGVFRPLNICVSHEPPDFLKTMPPFKYGIKAPYALFLLIAVVCYNVPINYVAYLILAGVQLLVNRIQSFSFVSLNQEAILIIALIIGQS